MGGLLLLDLPDHDSVLAGATGSVNRLVSLADLMVWVLDPQKYADAAVHRRYLVPMAGHSSVISLVLNQADLLTPQEAHDCVEDLQPPARNRGPARQPGAGHLGRHRRRDRGTAAGPDQDRVGAAGEHGADLRGRGRAGGAVRPYAGPAGPRRGARDQHSDALVAAFAQAAGVPGVGRVAAERAGAQGG